jgi:hypothetical protein
MFHEGEGLPDTTKEKRARYDGYGADEQENPARGALDSERPCTSFELPFSGLPSLGIAAHAMTQTERKGYKTP